MAQIDRLIEAAKSIRPFLNDLMGIDDAQVMDSQLSHLIAQYQAGEQVSNSITQLLAGNESTRNWVRQFNQKQRADRGGFEALPGMTAATSPPRHTCPLGNDYVWYRFDSSEEIPICPTHKVTLVLEEDT
ncbi:MAG: hypothetical protein HLUCCA11_23720 [Phormidesmis priestleyi Ana]|uniref:Uncharacterized protein n=1 Tax=Phormidesmis priestleyi Ana TaxID=1666911 RepID=A0A0P8BD05_9CYAN|nr:MAG: hypothetical protein HLUCCA11_23720 [Phormidesmis priestleyi Ana]